MGCSCQGLVGRYLSLVSPKYKVTSKSGYGPAAFGRNSTKNTDYLFDVVGGKKDIPNVLMRYMFLYIIIAAVTGTINNQIFRYVQVFLAV